jgi:HEAT repeat protein
VPLFGPNVEKLKQKGDVEGLIKVLRHRKKDIRMRQAAAQALGELGDRTAVKPLIAVLRSSGLVDLRVAAVRALGMIRDPAAVTELVKVLGHDRLAAQAREALVAIGRPAVPSLLEALKQRKKEGRQQSAWELQRSSRDVHKNRTAAQALARIGDQRAIEPLVTTLTTHSHSDMRLEAASALDQLGWVPGEDATGVSYWMAKQEWDRCVAIGRPAVQSLIQALEDSRKEVRLRAVGALGKIGEKSKSIPALKRSLKDHDEQVRLTAIEALARIGGPSALKALGTALRNPMLSVFAAALSTLARDGSQRAVSILEKEVRTATRTVHGATYSRSDANEAIVDAMAHLGPRSFDSLSVAMLEGGSQSARQKAIEALAGMDDPRVGSVLGEALRDEDWSVRQRAAEELGRILPRTEDVVAIQALKAALGDPDHRVRRSVAEALVKAGQEEGVAVFINDLRAASTTEHLAVVKRLAGFGTPAVRPLIGALQAKVESIRSGAVMALGQIGDPRAVEPLCGALARDQSMQVRKQAASELGRALQRAEEPDAIEALKAALGDPEKDVRWQAALVLVEAGQDEGVAELIDAFRTLPEWRRDWYAERLAGSDEQALMAVTGALQAEDSSIRVGAAEVLGQMGDPRALKRLVAALQGVHPELWHPAAQALVRIGDPRAVEPLIAALQGGHPELRTVAAGALGQIADARAVAPLVAALRGDHLELRKLAAEALGQIGDARAVEPLVAAFRGDDRALASAAADALVRIGGAQAVDRLSETLLAGRQELRRPAAEALARIGDPRAVAPLLSVADELGDWAGFGKALSRLGWQHCLALGAQAMKPLHRLLAHQDYDIRKGAASTLVQLYRSDKLNRKEKAWILNNRPRIRGIHTDTPGHTDTHSWDCHHKDSRWHRDTGVDWEEIPL